jgi:hypothetical protein
MIGVLFVQFFKGLAFGWIAGTIEAYSEHLWYVCMSLLVAVLLVGVFVVGTEEVASSESWGWTRILPLLVGVWSGEAGAKIAYKQAFGE